MADWGMKVSKEGFDVGTADVTNLVFTSSLDIMKTKSVGTFTGAGTVTHGLPYTPIFFVTQSGFAPYGASDISVDSTNLIKTSSGTSTYYIFYRQL
jgi:hypothetical protein